MKLADSRHGVMYYTPPSFNIISFTCFVPSMFALSDLLPYLRMISLGSSIDLPPFGLSPRPFTHSL